MIIYGTCIGESGKYEKYCLPGLMSHKSVESKIIQRRNSSSIFHTYNEIIEEALSENSLSGLVLLHDDVEILDAQFEQKVKRALTASANVGVVGPVGATGVSGLRWWEGSTMHGRVFESRGILEGNGWSAGAESKSVEVIDGLLMVIRPDVLRKVKFDEKNYTGFHGYDADYCYAAKAAGYDLKTVDVNVAHHCTGGYGNIKNFTEAEMIFRQKWFRRGPSNSVDLRSGIRISSTPGSGKSVVLGEYLQKLR